LIIVSGHKWGKGFSIIMDVHRPLHRDKAFVQAVMCTLDIEAEIGEKTVLAAKRYLVHEQIYIIYICLDTLLV
jgi:hypothetical protein